MSLSARVFLTVFGCTAVPNGPPSSAGAVFKLNVNQTVPNGVLLRGKMFLTANQSNPSGGVYWTEFSASGNTSYYGAEYVSSIVPNDQMMRCNKVEIWVFNANSGLPIDTAPRGTIDPFSPDGSSSYQIQ